MRGVNPSIPTLSTGAAGYPTLPGQPVRPQPQVTTRSNTEDLQKEKEQARKSREAAVAKQAQQQAVQQTETKRDEAAAAREASGGVPAQKPGASLLEPSNGYLTAGSRVYNDPPDPVSAPYLLPGVRASQETNTWLNGEIYCNSSYTARTTNWAFRFHWNPATMYFQNSTALNLSRPANDLGNVVGPGLETLDFEFYLNRQYEVAERKKLSSPMLGGKQTFYDVGTLHDIEFLYRTINGDPHSGSNFTDAVVGPNYKPDAQGTANAGLLQFSFVVARFNNIKFPGYVSSLGIEHLLFSEKMVPMVSKVSITMSRLLNMPL